MTSHPIVASSTLSSVSPRGACPLIDSLTSVSLFAWSQSSPGTVSHPKPSLYLSPSSHHLAGYSSSSFCDSVSPVLLGAPHNTPLDKKWTYRIIKRSPPGCYLAATALALPSVEHVSVSLEGVPGSTLQLERLQASLYFVMVSANGGDRNFTQHGPIDQVDSVVQVAGYRYAPFLREHEDALILHYTGENTPEKTNSSIGRILKRYEQLTTTTNEQGLILNETTLEGLSQRFNFLLSVGAFAVLLDHNGISSRTPTGIQSRAGPYQRLIGPGTYVSFDGAVRYGQLTLHHLTYQNRVPFLTRLTLYPLVVLPEGVSAFDIFYATDGLDATFIDSRPMERLLLLDWHQLMLDFRLGRAHPSKGHILAEEQLTDVLTTCPLSQMRFDWKTAAELSFLEVQEEEQLKSESVRLSLQSVTYNYGNSSSGTLMVTWNAYAKIEPEHLTSHSPSPPALYLYLRSYLLSYSWYCESPGKMLQKTESLAFVASQSPTASDLHRAGWSPRLYAQWLPVYRSRLEPYSQALEQWLTGETRHLVGGEVTHNGTFQRASPLAEKLAYRNAYFNGRIKTMTMPTGVSGKHTGDTLRTTLKEKQPATEGETTAQWKMSK